MPLVPGPPGVWHAADVATKTQQRDSMPLNAGGGAGNRKFPSVVVAKFL